MSAAITFEAASKSFGRGAARRLILDGFSLEVGHGELVALLGPSGVGKSTLLHLLAGLETCDAGATRLHAAAGDRAARVGMVFQEPRLLNWLSVERNVAVAVQAAGGDERLVAHFLAEVGLADQARAFPLHLSGGQRQRVSLARALAIRPDVLLLDEPFSALDEENAHRLRALLQTLWMGHPLSGLLVTHNLAEAAFLADRIVVVAGPPLRVLDVIEVGLARPRHPEDPALARLIGRIRATTAASRLDA